MSFGYPENQADGQQGPPLEVSEFSGGKTDVFIDGPSNSCKEADNLLITKNKKLRQRDGTLIFDTDNEQTPGGNARVGEFVRTDNDLFSQVGRNLYFIDGGVFSTLTGPTGNAAFSAGDMGSHIAWSEWNKNYILTNDDFSAPMKLYSDETDTNKLVQAGLPAANLWSAIEIANSLRTNYSSHIADAAAHSAPGTPDLVNTLTTPAAFDFESLAALTTDLIQSYDDHDADAELVVPVFHPATEASDHSLSDITAPQSVAEVKVRLDDLKSKLNAHDADGSAHGATSSHQTALFSEPQFAFTADSNNYTYTIVAFFEYKVGTVTFQDIGPTFTRQIEGMVPPDVGAVTITQIPTIVNGATQNYDTASIKWQIYRSQANGTTSTLVGEVANGVALFVDSQSDDDIENNRSLYRDGGIQSNDPPPKSKYNVTVNNSTWYGHALIGTSQFKSRLYQSIQFDPDSVPGSFFIDIEDEIVGLGAINIYPIVFCKNHIYRIEGTLDELGNGVLVKRNISRTIGGINHLSIVDSREGLLFAGTDGFYFTDGFNVKKLTNQLDDSYLALIDTDAQRQRITGEYEKGNNRILWAVSSSTASVDNDLIWALDLKWGINANSAFTTISNENSWAPSALGLTPDGKTLVIGDRRGYVFKFDDQTFTDPKIDIVIDNSLWQTKAIIYNFEWIKTKFDNSYRRKWVTGIVVNLENVTNLSLSIQSENDNSRNFIPLREIRFRENITWGDAAGPDWGDFSKDFLWNTFPIISAKRRMPRTHLRCTFKSVKFTNSTTIITNSDTLGTANVDASAKTATVTAPNAWPSDIVDQFLTFSNDAFVNQYLVTTRVSDTVVTFQDATSSAPTGLTETWLLKGIAKGELFAMSNFSLQWLPLSATHLPYGKSDTGANS